MMVSLVRVHILTNKGLHKLKIKNIIKQIAANKHVE